MHCLIIQSYNTMTSKALKRSTDASKDGIGAVLLQETDGEWMPVVYASRSMTAAERIYAPPRLQRFLLRIQKYGPKLQRTLGKLLVAIDTLSIAFSPKQVASSTESEVHVHVCAIKSGLPVSQLKWAELSAATVNDSVLQRVIRCITDG